MDTALNKEADRLDIPVSVIVRRCIETGLPAIKKNGF